MPTPHIRLSLVPFAAALLATLGDAAESLKAIARRRISPILRRLTARSTTG